MAYHRSHRKKKHTEAKTRLSESPLHQKSSWPWQRLLATWQSRQGPGVGLAPVASVLVEHEQVSHGEWIIPAVMYGISLYIYMWDYHGLYGLYIYMWIIYHVLCGMSRMHIQVIIAPFVPGYWDSHGWTHSISRS